MPLSRELRALLRPGFLKGRTALITGSSRGIGRECALALARAGCNVAVCAKSVESSDTLPGSIYTVADEIEQAGGAALAIQLDVTDADAIEAAVDRTADHFGSLDVLVNNAGALWWEDVLDTPVSKYDLINNINSRASFVAARAALPHMQKNGRGTIVMMSPPIDTDMLPGKTGYCVSKFGMTLTAMGVAAEHAGTGITACSLWPATLVESQATINHNIGGGPATWRKAGILSDALLGVLHQNEDAANEGAVASIAGKALIDEAFLRGALGVEDFAVYRCDPDREPPTMAQLAKSDTHGRGDVGKVKKPKMMRK